MKATPTWSLIIFALGAIALHAAPRVALMNFSSDDSSYRSAAAAVDFSDVLQAKLTGDDDVEWVERSQIQAAISELNLTAGGYVSPASALRLGKFVKADLLIDGEFTSTPDGRKLQLEVIDLQHADVLAETSLPIQGVTNVPLEVSVTDVASAGQSTKDLLRQALERSAQMQNQTVVAPLFFANTSASRRLDHFENELQSALNETMQANHVRMLQFPRAATAADEAGLVVEGLVEQDPAAWQKVANLYVWGQFEELTPDKFAFQDTPVKLTLYFWDGSDNAQSVTQTAKVSDLPLLKKWALDQILSAAKSCRKEPPSDGARLQVAHQLFGRACDIQKLFKPEVYSWPLTSFLDTPQGHQLWLYQVKLLTTARFFAPESWLIHRIWLDTRWELSPPSFWRWMEQIRYNDDFDDEWGLISPTKIDGADSLPEGDWSNNYKHPRACYANLGWVGLQDSICGAIDLEDRNGLPFKRPSDFPSDAPATVLESWKSHVKDDMARRLFKMYDTCIHANPPIPDPNANMLFSYGIPGNLKDPEMKAKFVEDLWPAVLGAHLMVTGRHEYSPQEYNVFFVRGLFPDLRRTFAAVGRPEVAEAMIAQFKQKVTIVENPAAAEEQAEAHPKKIARVNLFPPKLAPELRSVVFPPDVPGVNGVVALTFHNGALWVSTRGGAMNMSDPGWEYLVNSHTNAALWRLESTRAVPDLLSQRIDIPSKITSFCAQNDKLWMTLQDNGVFSLDPDTMQVTRYGDKEGVLSSQMFSSALMGDRMFFGGGEPNNGKLNYLDLPGADQGALTWRSQDTAGFGQIKLLQPFGHHLLINDKIFDLSNRSWEYVPEMVPGANKPGLMNLQPPAFDVLSATADPKALWIGTTLGLVSYNPDTGVRHEWLSPETGCFVDADGKLTSPVAGVSRLWGAVTALASDGDFLWVATTTRFDLAMSGAGTKGRWINDDYVLSLLPGIDSGSAGKDGNWRNMYAENERDYVMLLYKPTGKWVGYFPVTSRVTSFAISDSRLWIGLEDTGYVQADGEWKQEMFAPSPLLEVEKSPLLSIPQSQWVSDNLSSDELNSRIQEAKQALMVNIDPPPVQRQSEGQDRYWFIENNLDNFPTIDFQKASGGRAVLLHLPVQKNLIEHNGIYYFAFKFKTPSWLDGNYEWMYALAKTESQKAFLSHGTMEGVSVEHGNSTVFSDVRHDTVKNYPALKRQFPYSYTLNIEDVTLDQLKPDRTYIHWFGVHEKDYPDMVIAMTIKSKRGADEFGILPLDKGQ